jgi:hypothetical protein
VAAVQGVIVDEFQEIESGKENDRPQIAAAIAASRPPTLTRSGRPLPSEHVTMGRLLGAVAVGRMVAAARTAGGPGEPSWLRYCKRHVFARPDCAMGGPHGGAPRGPIPGGLHGGGAPHFAMGGPHGGGGPHGTPLRLGTRSRHGRRAPRGAPLHGGRQRQIRGSVPSHGARVLEVRIHLPPGESLLRTWFRGHRKPMAIILTGSVRLEDRHAGDR